MAQAHRRLGSKVTVIERSRCLSKDDEEHATLLLQRLAAEGVTLRQKTGVTAVMHGPHGPNGIVLSLDEGGQMSEIEGSHLLVATGRSPRVDALGLDQAGVTVDKGGIVVDAKLRTNVHGVYAIGDVVATQGTALHSYRRLPRRHRGSERLAAAVRQARLRIAAVGHLLRPGTCACGSV